MRKIALSFFACLCVFALAAKAAGIDVKSPDGKISFLLSTGKGQLNYSISFNGMPVILNSPFILTLDGKTISGNARILNGEIYRIDESFPWRGHHAIARNRCNGNRVKIISGGISYTIDLRVFDDGAAFRIIIPGKPGQSRVPDESTVFTLPAGTRIWYHDLYMHYEGVHVQKEIGNVQAGEWMAPPATFKLSNNTYASVTEADLKNYSGMALQADGKNGLVLRLAQHQPTSYPYRLRYSPEDTLRLLQPAAIKGVITTPWRVVMIGKDLNALVNSDIVHALCPPPDKSLFPDGINTAWIRPGRAVWKYLDGGGEGSPEVMKHFTDGAAALGFEHNILEGFWSRWTDEQIKDLVNYARQRKVDIWVWKHSKTLRSDTARKNFFKRLHDLGIRGAKIDFFDHEAKEVVDLYTDILREAAKNKIMLDFHGANKPTGLSRTWPNELTREAVKGMEASKLEDRATHETTIPFTRCLAGPAEYTVMLFGDRKKNTTIAHQIASAAILDAPMLTYATHPDTILASPAVQLIKDIPATWDETIVLPGSEIGELAAFARRKGTSWFIAVMNGNTKKKLTIPLHFLEQGNYKGIFVKDDADKNNLIIENKTTNAGNTLELELAPGGGFIAELSSASPFLSRSFNGFSAQMFGDRADQ